MKRIAPLLILLLILINFCNAQFVNKQYLGPAGDGPKLVLTDLDQDGYNDIVRYCNSYCNDYGITIFKNLNGSFTAADSICDGWIEGLVMLDFDGDSDTDIVATGHVSGGAPILFWLEKTGAGYNQFNSRQTILNTAFDELLLLDIDNDSDDDLILYSQADSIIYSMENTGAGIDTTKNILISNIPVSYFFRLKANDIDSDGDKDLILSYNTTPYLSSFAQNLVWYENIGVNSFSQTENIISTSLYGWRIEFDVADVDNDGDKDVMAFSEKYNSGANPPVFDSKIVMFEATSPGNIDTNQIFITNDYQQLFVLRLADLNNDTLPELITLYYFNNISFKKNLGNNLFDNISIIDTTVYSDLDIEIADMDNDGDLDLLTPLYYFENNGSPLTIENLKVSEENIDVYPNPFNNELVIDLPHNNYDVSFYNLLGERVFWKTSLTKNKLLINQSDLGKGVFILKLKNNSSGSIDISKIVSQ